MKIPENTIIPRSDLQDDIGSGFAKDNGGAIPPTY